MEDRHFTVVRMKYGSLDTLVVEQGDAKLIASVYGHHLILKLLPGTEETHLGEWLYACNIGEFTHIIHNGDVVVIRTG